MLNSNYLGLISKESEFRRNFLINIWLFLQCVCFENFKAGVCFRNFSSDQKNYILRTIFSEGRKKPWKDVKILFCQKSSCEFKSYTKITAKKLILCELLRLHFKRKSKEVIWCFVGWFIVVLYFWFWSNFKILISRITFRDCSCFFLCLYNRSFISIDKTTVLFLWFSSPL